MAAEEKGNTSETKKVSAVKNSNTITNTNYKYKLQIQLQIQMKQNRTKNENNNNNENNESTIKGTFKLNERLRLSPIGQTAQLNLF